jgi:hypothetical protein
MGNDVAGPEDGRDVGAGEEMVVGGMSIVRGIKDPAVGKDSVVESDTVESNRGYR